MKLPTHLALRKEQYLCISVSYAFTVEGLWTLNPIYIQVSEGFWGLTKVRPKVFHKSRLTSWFLNILFLEDTVCLFVSLMNLSVSFSHRVLHLSNPTLTSIIHCLSEFPHGQTSNYTLKLTKQALFLNNNINITDSNFQWTISGTQNHYNLKLKCVRIWRIILIVIELNHIFMNINVKCDRRYL